MSQGAESTQSISLETIIQGLNYDYKSVIGLQDELKEIYQKLCSPVNPIPSTVVEERPCPDSILERQDDLVSNIKYTLNSCHQIVEYINVALGVKG